MYTVLNDSKNFPIKSWRLVEIMQACSYGFEYDSLCSFLPTWACVSEYYIALHDKEKETHIHCFIKFKDPVPTHNIINFINKHFDNDVIQFQHLNKIRNGWASAVSYGSHLNAPEKYAYHLDPEFKHFTNIENVNSLVVDVLSPIKNKRLREIESYIAAGTLTRKNFFVSDLVNSADYMNYHLKIDLLFDYYEGRDLALRVASRKKGDINE